MTEEVKPFRVLSLDGGGIRGLFTAAFLAHIEEQAKKPLSSCFDLIVGTSTGGIIALAIGSGIRACDVLRFYLEEGKSIFSKARPWPIRLMRPKYDAEPLYEALKKFLGTATMNDSKTKLCITSYESVEGTPRVIKTDHAEGLHWGGEQLMWKVGAATSAAPTYFPAFQISTHDSHLDGGVWANNPVHVGIAEAIYRLGQRLDNLAILSVGTGSKRFTLSYTEASRRGLIQWVRPSFDLLIGSQSFAAHHSAKFLLDSGTYIRIDIDLAEPVALDDYEESLPLVERGYQAGRIHRDMIAKNFC